MGSLIWTFLNSNIGMLVVGTIASTLFVRAVKNPTRRARILAYSKEAFELAEMAGVRQELKGNAKYLVYVEELVRDLAARGEKPLTKAESDLLERQAYVQAMKAKPR